MSKSYDLEEKELYQDYMDGYISREEYDVRLNELKHNYRKDSRVKDKRDEQEE